MAGSQVVGMALVALVGLLNTASYAADKIVLSCSAVSVNEDTGYRTQIAQNRLRLTQSGHRFSKQTLRVELLLPERKVVIYSLTRRCWTHLVCNAVSAPAARL
jgi:hypothetical protein